MRDVTRIKKQNQGLQSEKLYLIEDISSVQKERDDLLKEVEQLKKEEKESKRDVFHDELREYRDIDNGIPESTSPQKLRKMLSKSIRDTEISYQIVKEIEASMYTMFEATHRIKRRNSGES